MASWFESLSDDEKMYFAELDKRRKGRSGEGPHSVYVREPTAANATLLRARFGSRQEAEEFAKDYAIGLPEGSLLFVTGVYGPSATKRAFIVNEYGEATPRRIGNRWVPDYGDPVEWEEGDISSMGMREALDALQQEQKGWRPKK